MNIIEAYIKFKGQLIILISGLSGSGKTLLGKKISKDFNLKFIDTSDYCDKKFNNKIKVGDIEIINYDSDDIYKWNEINEIIEKNSSNGIILTSTIFPKDKLESNIDFHINIRLTKNNLFAIREKYIENHDCAIPEENLEFRTKIFKKITYVYYLDIIKRSIINYTIDGNKYVNNLLEYNNKIYDEAFNYLINAIEKIIYNL
jgi:adenylate kinase family enzyme